MVLKGPEKSAGSGGTLPMRTEQKVLQRSTFSSALRAASASGTPAEHQV
jgi:hypothetical protein